MTECVILVGLQGAGKTTFYQRRFAGSHAHVSMDRFPNARHKAARMAAEITRALDAGRSVVVDNTNPSIAVRAPLIRLARAHGAAVVGYYLEATTREALARNRRREGKARIPDVGIFATAKRLEPPLRAEGFDRLYRVRLLDDGSFAIDEWEGDMTRFREHGTAGRCRVWLPPGYDEQAQPWPLILFLHGRDESGADNTAQTTVGLGPALVRHPDRWPFVVLFPQKPERDKPWDPHRDMVQAMLDETSRTYRIDPARVYLTGVSQGAHETLELGAARPEQWSALAPVCGYGPPDQYARALATMPVWVFHSQADPIVPHECSAAIVRALQAAGGPVRFTSYPGVGHDAWEPAYAEPELPKWLLEHARQAHSP